MSLAMLAVAVDLTFAISPAANPHRECRNASVQQAMGPSMLMYRCPKTDKSVRTSIETNASDLRRLASFKLSVWCPHCHDAHAILGKDAFVASSKVTAAAA